MCRAAAAANYFEKCNNATHTLACRKKSFRNLYFHIAKIKEDKAIVYSFYNNMLFTYIMSANNIAIISYSHGEVS